MGGDEEGEKTEMRGAALITKQGGGKGKKNDYVRGLYTHALTWNRRRQGGRGLWQERNNSSLRKLVLRGKMSNRLGGEKDIENE